MSAQQRVIRDLLIEGLSNKEISRKIGLSHRTVEWHRQEILRKTGVKSVLALLRRTYDERIAEMQAQINAKFVDNARVISRQNREPDLYGAA